MSRADNILEQATKPTRFTAYAVSISGRLSNRAELNADELDTWMHDAYGKHAVVQVKAYYATGKSKTIRYTDNGKKFVKTA